MPPAELAADEYLRLFPDLAKFRPDLTVLAQAGWRGEWPLEFFRKISDLVRYLPWLREQLHRWLDPAVIAAIREQPLPDGTVESFNAWTAQHATVDITTGPWQFEGFLLLSRLTWGVGNNEPAHRMLSAILAKVSYGLAWIKKDGKPARSPRSHPLKQRMYSMRDLQTIEAVGDSLKAFISDTRASYPRFAQFLHDAYLPLILGTPRIWTAPASVTGDDDLLGIDKDPLSPVPTKIGQEPLEDFADLESGDSPREARAFTKSDVAEEMLVMVSELAPEKGVITALAEAWKGEDTWDFFESIHRLNHWVHWVTPILQKRFDLSALQVVGQTLRSKDRRQAEKKARKWRQQKYLAPKVLDGPSALVTPSNKDRRMGIFHLRGFLLVGRVECDPETIAGPDNALSEVISNLQRRIIRKLSVEEIADGFEQQHPVELVLDRIGNPNTPGELAAEIELLLPEISSLHALYGLHTKSRRPQETARKVQGHAGKRSALGSHMCVGHGLAFRVERSLCPESRSKKRREVLSFFGAGNQEKKRYRSRRNCSGFISASGAQIHSWCAITSKAYVTPKQLCSCRSSMHELPQTCRPKRLRAREPAFWSR